MEVIADGIEDFVEKVVNEEAEIAGIQITIRPGDVVIAMKRKPNKDKNLGLKITFN